MCSKCVMNLKFNSSYIRIDAINYESWFLNIEIILIDVWTINVFEQRIIGIIV